MYKIVSFIYLWKCWKLLTIPNEFALLLIHFSQRDVYYINHNRLSHSLVFFISGSRHHIGDPWVQPELQMGGLPRGGGLTGQSLPPQQSVCLGGGGGGGRNQTIHSSVAPEKTWRRMKRVWWQKGVEQQPSWESENCWDLRVNPVPRIFLRFQSVTLRTASCKYFSADWRMFFNFFTLFLSVVTPRW